MNDAAEILRSKLFIPSKFCDILNRARLTRFPGAWSGSAYRNHPCGIVRGVIKLTDDWRVGDTCSICITDGSGWNVRDISRDSWGSGSPNPSPVDGRTILAWDTGKWQSDELRESLEPVVLKILVSAVHHAISYDNMRVCVDAQARHTQEVESKAAQSAAIAKAMQL